jgi:hypothetical protein
MQHTSGHLAKENGILWREHRGNIESGGPARNRRAARATAIHAMPS